MNPAPVNPEVEALLQKLNDIETLQTVTWWPPAPGWWVLSLCVILGVSWSIYAIFQRVRTTAYKRAARHALQRIQTAQSAPSALREANLLLKRVAISAYPHLQLSIKQLNGAAWADWLLKVCPRAPLSKQLKSGLAVGLYQPDCDVDQTELLNFVSHWVDNHPRKLPAHALLALSDSEPRQHQTPFGAQHV